MWSEASGSAECHAPQLGMQRSATQGEQLDAHDSWSASLACVQKALTYCSLIVLHSSFGCPASPFFYLISYLTFFFLILPAAFLSAFCWTECFLSKWTFFALRGEVGGLLVCMGVFKRAFTPGAIWSPLMPSLNSAAFLCWNFCHSGLTPTDCWEPKWGFGRGSCSMQKIFGLLHTPFPLAPACFFASLHINTAHACTHVQCHINEWIAWR